MQPITTPSSSIPLSNCSPSPPHHHHHHLITATILFLSRLWLASSCVFPTRSAHHRSPALCPPLMDGGAPRPESEVPSFIVIYFLLLFVKARLFPLLPLALYFLLFICMPRLVSLLRLVIYFLLLFVWHDSYYCIHSLGSFITSYFLYFCWCGPTTATASIRLVNLSPFIFYFYLFGSTTVSTSTSLCNSHHVYWINRISTFVRKPPFSTSFLLILYSPIAFRMTPYFCFYSFFVTWRRVFPLDIHLNFLAHLVFVLQRKQYHLNHWC